MGGKFSREMLLAPKLTMRASTDEPKHRHSPCVASSHLFVLSSSREMFEYEVTVKLSLCLTKHQAKKT
jgi:hypothetical protein